MTDLDLNIYVLFSVVYYSLKKYYGTGSYPLPPQGLQRSIRFIVSHNPFHGPYFRSASIAYCEQVGVNLHDGGVKGDIQF